MKLNCPRTRLTTWRSALVPSPTAGGRRTALPRPPGRVTVWAMCRYVSPDHGGPRVPDSVDEGVSEVVVVPVEGVLVFVRLVVSVGNGFCVVGNGSPVGSGDCEVVDDSAGVGDVPPWLPLEHWEVPATTTPAAAASIAAVPRLCMDPGTPRR